VTRPKGRRQGECIDARAQARQQAQTHGARQTGPAGGLPGHSSELTGRRIRLRQPQRPRGGGSRASGGALGTDETTQNENKKKDRERERAKDKKTIACVGVVWAAPTRPAAGAGELPSARCPAQQQRNERDHK
jgi:hypothetical protein